MLVAFLVVPLVEIWAIIQVGQVIGPWWTILLLVLDAVIGTWLVRREGRRAWTVLRAALESGRMPARELADGILILVGGVLMVAPGFLTDVVGILCVLPLTRPFGRRLLTGAVRRRLAGGRLAGDRDAGAPRDPRDPRTARSPGDHEVVRGDVVE